jgi:high-affinity Fe2+/Pb2+ permease
VSNARWVTTLVLGVIMFAMGLFVALRPLWSHNAVFLGARWLDLTFAVVFMLRGLINVRTARGRMQRMPAQG